MTKLEKSVYKAREIYDRLSGRNDLTSLQRYICEASGTIVLLADEVDGLEYAVAELETADL